MSTLWVSRELVIGLGALFPVLNIFRGMDQVHQIIGVVLMRGSRPLEKPGFLVGLCCPFVSW